MNEIQALRFHTSADYMLDKRHAALKFNIIVPLIADPSLLMPFQISYAKYTNVAAELTTAEVVNFYTNTAVSLLPYLTFGFHTTTPTISRHYITYISNSTLPALKQGVYYLHLVNADGEWWSDLFKIGTYDTIKLEYRNKNNFGNIVFPNLASLSATFATKTYDTGEYSEHSEVNKDADNFDIYTYRRADKLRASSLLGDSNTLDLLKFIQMCDTVYLTDEINRRQSIEITEITADAISKSNYHDITFKYRVKNTSLISVNITPTVSIHAQVPPGSPELTDGLQYDGNNLEFDGKILKFN